MKQIHITQIQNGWLVMTPPKAPNIQHLNAPKPEPQPETFFCATIEEVCAHLQSLGLE